MILPSRVPCKAVAAANAHCLKLSFQIFCICGLGLTLSVLATVDHANFTVRWVPVEMITDQVFTNFNGHNQSSKDDTKY